MAKLVYIVGVGHSGSTLLDIVTGTIPRVFSTGELGMFPLYVNARGTRCSCGARFRECPVWIRVVPELSRQVGFDVFENPSRFRMALLQTRRWAGAKKGFDHWWWALHKAAFGLVMQHQRLRPLETPWVRAMSERLVRNWQVIDTIGRLCDSEYVVDSSKEVYRLKLLHAQRPGEVYALLLVRDLCGVVNSWRRHGREPVKQAHRSVGQYNRILATARNMPGLHFAIVRYERLCADPVGERKRIAAFLGLPDPGAELVVDPSTQHLVAGNPMRLRGQMEIRLDESWKAQMEPDLQRTIRQIEAHLDPGWREPPDDTSGRPSAV